VCQNSALRFAATDQGGVANTLLYSGPKDLTNRKDMTLRLSFDEGLTWTNDTLVCAGSAAYSDLVKLDGPHAGVLYEADDYGKINFGSYAVVPESSTIALLISANLEWAVYWFGRRSIPSKKEVETVVGEYGIPSSENINNITQYNNFNFISPRIHYKLEEV
jgi:hypothetical protein